MNVADLISGSLLVCLGIILIIAALRMPISDTYGGVANSWYASPAAFPILIGGSLILASSCILFRSLSSISRTSLHSVLNEWIRAPRANREIHRSFFILAVLFAYVLLLELKWMAGAAIVFNKLGLSRFAMSSFLCEAGGANYFISSSLFLTGFILLFSTRNQSGHITSRVGIALVIGILVPLMTGYLFSGPLMVPLP